MQVVSTRQLEGVNRWFPTRTLEAVVSGVPEAPVPASLVASLSKALDRLTVPPYLAGSASRLVADAAREDSWPGLIGSLVREWQFLIREFRGAAACRRAANPDTWTLALECEEFAAGEACLRASLAIVDRLRDGAAVDLAADFERLGDRAYEVCFGGMSTAIVDAARLRAIPVRRIDPDGLIQLGEGVHQRRFAASITGQTSHLAVEFSTNKRQVKDLWARMGIPIADGRAVVDGDDAVRAAEELGWPVVVKPADSDYGLGVALDLTTAEQVREAYPKALARSATGVVLVERFLKGLWHRLLVVDDRLIAALRREPAAVMGDGRQSLSELVERANRDLRRGPDSRWPLYTIELGEKERQYVARSGYTPESVPQAGESVALRSIAHTETGATSSEVLDQVHPATVELARDAVRVIGLDVAGLDVIADDLSQPLAEQGGGFLEINAGPAIFLHIEPVSDPPRPVGEAIVESLIPAPADGRVPLVVVVGESAAERIAAEVASFLRGTVRGVALSTIGATGCDARRLCPVSPAPADRLDVMMLFPRTQLAVLAVSPAALLDSGLGTDRCRLLVLVDPGADTRREELEPLIRQIGRVARSVLVPARSSGWDDWLGDLPATRVVRADDLVSAVVTALLNLGTD